MISITVYVGLIAVAFGLMIYSMVHLENRLFGNIITSILSVILYAMLALWSLSGSVIQTDNLMNQTVNGTESVMSVETIHTSYADPALGYFFALIAVVMFLFSAALIWDAYQEQIMPERDEEYSEDYK